MKDEMLEFDCQSLSKLLIFSRRHDTEKRGKCQDENRLAGSASSVDN
jgi:hypothetical protein